MSSDGLVLDTIDASWKASRLAAIQDIREVADSMRPSYYIYYLLEPTRDVIRYVGICINPVTRYQSHLMPTGGNGRCRKWISRLRTRGLAPRMQIAATVSKPTRGVTMKMRGTDTIPASHALEKWYIQEIARCGRSPCGIPAKLLNVLYL